MSGECPARLRELFQLLFCRSPKKYLFCTVRKTKPRPVSPRAGRRVHIVLNRILSQQQYLRLIQEGRVNPPAPAVAYDVGIELFNKHNSTRRRHYSPCRLRRLHNRLCPLQFRVPVVNFIPEILFGLCVLRKGQTVHQPEICIGTY